MSNVINDNDDASLKRVLTAVVHQNDAHAFKSSLKQRSLDDKARTVIRLDTEHLSIPVLNSLLAETMAVMPTSVSADNNDPTVHYIDGIPFRLKSLPVGVSHVDGNTGGSRCVRRRMHDRLLESLRRMVVEREVEWVEELERDVPRSWEIYGDLVMLREGGGFTNDSWKQFGAELWCRVAASFDCQRVAVAGSIFNSEYRSPSARLLIGESGWVERTENRIRYAYDVTRCMFSAGNITEKLRISRFDCRGETIVDLFAGIGYFTLPYLVHARAERVFACEWNPAAVEALIRTLKLNNVQQRCIVLEGDNRTTCPLGVADRVNLGLIPSSESYWSLACRALRQDRGGFLHIHGNVTSAATSQHTTAIIAPVSQHQTAATTSPLQPHRPVTITKIGSVDDTDVMDTSCLRATVESDILRTPTHDDVDGLSLLRSSGGGRLRGEWIKYAYDTRDKIQSLFNELVQFDLESHGDTNKHCSVSVVHVERVKSYAPHIDHIVVDLLCKRC